MLTVFLCVVSFVVGAVVGCVLLVVGVFRKAAELRDIKKTGSEEILKRVKERHDLKRATDAAVQN